jgi:hypothetical protein
VITLNADVSSQAATDFMFYMTGLTDPAANHGYLRFAPLTRETFYEEPRLSPTCRECSALRGSRRGRGDLGPRLPTYYRPSVRSNEYLRCWWNWKASAPGSDNP